MSDRTFQSMLGLLLIAGGVGWWLWQKYKEEEPPGDGGNGGNGGPTTGSLYGIITDASTGSPISGVFVQAFSDVTNENFTASTNSSGYYSFSAIEVGGFTIMCVKDGYESVSDAGVIAEGNNQLNLQMISVSAPPGNGSTISLTLTKEPVCAAWHMTEPPECIEYFPDEREVKLTVKNLASSRQLVTTLEGHMYLDNEFNGLHFPDQIYSNYFGMDQSWVYSKEYVIPISGMNLSSHFFVTVTDGDGYVLIDRKEFVKSL